MNYQPARLGMIVALLALVAPVFAASVRGAPPTPTPAREDTIAIRAAADKHRAVAGTTDDEVKVIWNGKGTDLATIEHELGTAPATAAANWAPFATKHELDMHLTSEGRVLFLTRSSGGKVKKELELVDKTCRSVDSFLAPRKEEAAEQDTSAAGGEGDEEGEGEEGEEGSWDATAMEQPQDDETAVIVQAHDQEQYLDVLETIAEQESYLESWIGKARTFPGFTLSRPLCAAWIEIVDGQEEWDIRNELVHRLTHLLVSRRFGEQPHWLQLGIAWHVEEDLMGGIYCFPNRKEFVFQTEHTAWPSELANEFRRRDTPFFDDLCAWPRNTFRPAQARQAFGIARFLAIHHKDVFPAILDDLFEIRARDGVTRDEEAGTWELIPGWEPPAEAQLAVLVEHLGDDALDQIVEYFQKGKKYKPAKSKS